MGNAVEKINNPLLQDFVDLGLRGMLEKNGLNLWAFYRALSEEDLQRYTQLQEIRADILADETVYLADNEENYMKARNQIDSRKWLASKLRPKVYGDKLDLNVNHTVDLVGALSEAKARLVNTIQIEKPENSELLDLLNE